MQLITNDTITYRQPPTERQAEAAAAHRRLTAQGPLYPEVDDRKGSGRAAADEAHAADLARLAEAAGTLTEWKFTLATATVAGAGRFADATSIGRDEYREQNGREVVPDLRSNDVDIMRAALRHINRTGDYAAVMAAIVKIEERTRPRVDTDAGQWKEIEIPPEWSTMAGFFEHVPAGLANQLVEAAHSLNPGLWRTPSDEEAEKNAGASGA